MSAPKTKAKAYSKPQARRDRGLRVVSFWWPKDVMEEIDALAKRRGCSRSAMVAYMLEKFDPVEY